jgi:hypothetical protein
MKGSAEMAEHSRKRPAGIVILAIYAFVWVVSGMEMLISRAVPSLNIGYHLLRF